MVVGRADGTTGAELPWDGVELPNGNSPAIGARGVGATPAPTVIFGAAEPPGPFPYLAARSLAAAANQSATNCTGA